MQSLTPEELFFLGKYMNAKYIDYEYITMMDDLENNYSLKEREIENNLVNRGLLLEDFSGNIMLDAGVEQLLYPVFFGEYELEIYLAEKKENNIFLERRNKFHFYEDQVTEITWNAKKITISDSGSDKLKGIFQKVYDEKNTGKANILAIEKVEPKQIEKIMILKSIMIGEKSVNRQFIQLGGLWYIGKDENNLESLSNNQLKTIWDEMTRGK